MVAAEEVPYGGVGRERGSAIGAGTKTERRVKSDAELLQIDHRHAVLGSRILGCRREFPACALGDGAVAGNRAHRGQEHRLSALVLRRLRHHAKQHLESRDADVLGTGRAGGVVDAELDEQVVTLLHPVDHGGPVRLRRGAIEHAFAVAAERGGHVVQPAAHGGAAHGAVHHLGVAVEMRLKLLSPADGTGATAIRHGRVARQPYGDLVGTVRRRARRAAGASSAAGCQHSHHSPRRRAISAAGASAAGAERAAGGTADPAG